MPLEKIETGATIDISDMGWKEIEDLVRQLARQVDPEGNRGILVAGVHLHSREEPRKNGTTNAFRLEEIDWKQPNEPMHPICYATSSYDPEEQSPCLAFYFSDKMSKDNTDDTYSGKYIIKSPDALATWVRLNGAYRGEIDLEESTQRLRHALRDLISEDDD